ncbi:MAG: hypothetical protein QGF46_04180, partial [Planctomycetota bacterium]|nr:hypothetical protein [Planctomycetota bacterium]
AVAVIAAFVATNLMSKTYRSQARCYLPAQSDTLSLSAESGNLPTSPKLPTSHTETQAALLGVLNSAELRTTVAAQIEERDSEWLEKNVKFDLDTFNFIVISAYDPVPKVARRVAETYLREFSTKLDTSTKRSVADNVQILVSAIETTSERVSDLESQRQQFLEQNGAIDFSTEISQYHIRVTKFQDALDENTSSLASLQTQREEVIKNFESRPEFSQSGFTQVQNPRINQLRSQIAEAQLEAQNALLVYNEQHPDVIALNSKIDFLNSQLAAEEDTVESSRSFSTDSMRESYENRIAEFKVNEANFIVERDHYTNLLNESQSRLRELNKLKSEIEILESELRNHRDTLRQQRDRHAELNLYMSRTASFLLTAEAPVEATKPYFPILWLNLLVAALLGLVVSAAVIVTTENVTRYREAAPW